MEEAAHLSPIAGRSRPGIFASARNVAADSVSLDPTRVYCAEGVYEFLAGAMLDVELIAPTVEGKFMSAFSHVGTPSA